MSDSTSATDLYGDGELPGDADLNAPEASTETEENTDRGEGGDSVAGAAPEGTADTNTENNLDINLEDAGATGADSDMEHGETFTGLKSNLDSGANGSDSNGSDSNGSYSNGSDSHGDPNGDTNSEHNDGNFADEDSDTDLLPDGPGRDGGAPAAGTPLP